MVRPSNLGGLFDVRYIRQLLCNLSQIFQGKFRVSNLPATEADSDTNLHPMLKPPAGISYFKALMVVGCLWAQLNLFDLNFGLRFPCFPFLLFLSHKGTYQSS